MKRVKRTGRYTYDEKFDRLCKCGHRLGDHAAEGPNHPCFASDFLVIGCDCEKFRPVKTKP